MALAAEQLDLMRLRALVEDLFIEVRDLARAIDRIERRQMGANVPMPQTLNEILGEE